MPSFRSLFSNKRRHTREEVRDKFFKIVSLPPDVNYAIINRAPYSFYHNGKYIECRLNVQQISSKEVAIEISEGLWGTLTVKQFWVISRTIFMERREVVGAQYLPRKTL